MEDGPRKGGLSDANDDQDDRQSDDYGQGDSECIQISDDDQEDDDGFGASSGEEGPYDEEEDEEHSDGEWKGIAEFLGDEIVNKLRNKKK